MRHEYEKGIRRYFIILIVIIVCIVTLVDCTNTQTRQEERTSASHLIINWENEVQILMQMQWKILEWLKI